MRGDMEKARQNLTNHILQIVDEIFKIFGPVVPEEWLSLDLTVTQLRLLIILQTYGPSRMSVIAAGMGVTLPTTTIVVDNLVKKDLVIRDIDPGDRRVVICNLSPVGQKLIDALWVSGRTAIEKLLEDMTSQQLKKTTEVAELLRDKATKLRSNAP
jgi:DNA-binding MarR family transcriptional regulator